jgi:hypothetical protein
MGRARGSRCLCMDVDVWRPASLALHFLPYIQSTSAFGVMLAAMQKCVEHDVLLFEAQPEHNEVCSAWMDADHPELFLYE